MKATVVVRRESACFAPSTLVEGREEVMRSEMKLCAELEAGSRTAEWVALTVSADLDGEMEVDIDRMLGN